MRPVSLIGAVLILFAGLAEAGDLMVLKRAVERDDKMAVERWPAEEAKAKDTDSLAALHGRPVPQELSQKASALAAEDLMTTALAISFTTATDPGIKRQLLGRIDAALAARQAVTREVELVARMPPGQADFLRSIVHRRRGGRRQARRPLDELPA